MSEPPSEQEALSGPDKDLYESLVDGFREVSEALDQKHSTLAADPILVELTARVYPVQSSDGVRKALLFILDSREFSGAGEVIQYFAHRFGWDWLKREVEERYLDCLTNVNHRLARHYERMLEAFSRDWEDRDLFPSLDRL